MYSHISDDVLKYCKTAVHIPWIFAALQSGVLLLFVAFSDFQSNGFFVIPLLYLMIGYFNLKFFELFEKSVQYLLFKNAQKVLSQGLFLVLLSGAIIELIYQKSFICSAMFLVNTCYCLIVRYKRIYKSIDELEYFRGFPARISENEKVWFFIHSFFYRKNFAKNKKYDIILAHIYFMC